MTDPRIILRRLLDDVGAVIATAPSLGLSEAARQVAGASVRYGHELARALGERPGDMDQRLVDRAFGGD